MKRTLSIIALCFTCGAVFAQGKFDKYLGRLTEDYRVVTNHMASTNWSMSTFIRVDGGNKMTAAFNAGGQNVTNVSRILLGDGSTANPAVGFTADGTVGWYRVGTGRMALGASGTTVWQMSTNGMVLAGMTPGANPPLLVDAGCTNKWGEAAKLNGILNLGGFAPSNAASATVASGLPTLGQVRTMTNGVFVSSTNTVEQWVLLQAYVTKAVTNGLFAWTDWTAGSNAVQQAAAADASVKTGAMHVALSAEIDADVAAVSTNTTPAQVIYTVDERRYLAMGWGRHNRNLLNIYYHMLGSGACTANVEVAYYTNDLGNATAIASSIPMTTTAGSTSLSGHTVSNGYCVYLNVTDLVSTPSNLVWWIESAEVAP